MKKQSDRGETLRDKLEATGSHLTRQRAAVFDYLSQVEHHPTAEEVLEEREEMTKTEEKMICPDCGVEMNHHADKIDYTAALEGGGTADPAFGGIVEEAHTCPLCGRTHLRRAENEEER